MDKCQLNFNNSLNDGQYSKNLNKREIKTNNNKYFFSIKFISNPENKNKRNKKITKMRMNIVNFILKRNLSVKTIFKYDNSINILLMFIIFIFIVPIYVFLMNKSIFIKLNYISQITLTIKGNGTQKILGKDLPRNFTPYSGELPDHIYINGKLTNLTKVYKISGLKNEENDITLEWNSSLTNCTGMFNNLKNIIKIDASKFDASKVENMFAMFANCGNLKSINLNNFNTSSVTIMNAMFYKCTSLTYLKLHNFNTLRVTDFNRMFYYCTSLEILDIYNFQTNSSSTKTSIFSNCKSLKIVCLDINKVDSTFMNALSNIEINCEEVQLRLNLKKIFEKDIYLYSCEEDSEYKYDYNDTCYKSCPEKTYYNKKKCINIPDGYYLNDTNLMTIDKCDEKCKICSNESIYLNTCISCNTNFSYFPILNYNKNFNNSFIDCGKDIEEDYYFDLEDNTYNPCYSTCKKCSTYGNESQHNCDECKINYASLNDSNYNNNCYENCDFFYYFDLSNKFHCTKSENCPQEYKLIPEKKKCISNCYQDNYYKYEFNNICYDSCPNGTVNFNNLCKIEQQINNNTDKEFECNISDFFNDKCKIKNNTKSIDKIISNIKNEILNGDLLLNILNGNKSNIIKKEGNSIYSISPLDNQEDNKFNLSTVDIGECEGILRGKYNLSQNEPLFIFKIEYFIQGLLFPIIQYEIYSNKIKEELNMDLCKNIKINMDIPVSINEDKLFMHDPSNAYYNDFCYSYTTEDNTDIVITDRKKQFNDNKMSLCESNCIYKGYNFRTKKASCECQAKVKTSYISEIIHNKDKLIEKLTDMKIETNIGIIKCYYSLFTKEGLITNIGSYVSLSIIFIELILTIFFFCKGNYLFTNHIQNNIFKEKNQNELKIENSNKEKKLGKTKRKSKNNIKNNLAVTQSNPPRKAKSKIKRNIININNNKQKIQIINVINSSKKENIDSSSLIFNNREKIAIKKENFKYNNYELNNCPYQEALKIDKRVYFQYYLSLLKYNQLLIFTFYTSDDYNSRVVKISLFLFLFSLTYAVNSLFFNTETIHSVYIKKGVYNIIDLIPQIIYSSIICSIIKVIISYFSLTEKNIIETKKSKEANSEKIVKLFKFLFIKFILFYILVYIFLLLFWYYLACFCAVYKNSQVHVFKDTLISFLLSLLYPFGFCLFPGILRLIALKDKKGNKECLYKSSKILQLI